MTSTQIATSPGCLLLLVELVAEDGAGLDHQLEPLPGSFPSQLFELESEREPSVRIELACHHGKVWVLWWQRIQVLTGNSDQHISLLLSNTGSCHYHFLEDLLVIRFFQL